MNISKKRTFDYPPHGPRTRTQNLNRYLDNLEEFGAIGKPLAAEITRSPGRCLGCGHQLGQPHAPGCALALLA